MDINVVKNFILTQWLILTPLFILVFLVIQWKWYQRKNREIIKVASRLPIPVSYSSFLGTWYNQKSKFFIPIYTGEVFTHSFLAAMRAAADKPYSTFCMWVGPVPQIFVQKPHDVQIILTSSKALNKGPEYRFGKFAFGDGLITAPGTKWKISRRFMNSVFHGQNLDHLATVFNESSRQLVKDIAQHVGGEIFDVYQHLLVASVASVSSILFGLERQRKMDNKDFKLGTSILLRITHYTGERGYSPWLWSDCVFYILYKKKLEDLENTWIEFINQPTEEMESLDFLTVPRAYNNILQEYPTTFSEVDMHAEMKTILIAGSDTTAIGVGSCLLLLGAHPDIQEELYNEIMGLIDSEDQNLTIEDLNSLPFLDQVIKESLRMSTVLFAFQRLVNENIKLSECTIPKGGSVVISVIGLHFDPEVYPDPYVFKPERFTPENSAKRHPYSYLPFSGGPRNCIGKRFAMISMKIMLAHILRSYKISTTENLLDLRYVFTISLKSIEGFKISLESRLKDQRVNGAMC